MFSGGRWSVRYQNIKQTSNNYNYNTRDKTRLWEFILHIISNSTPKAKSETFKKYDCNVLI